MRRIRELSMEAGRNVKEKGLDNNLLELIAADDAFNHDTGRAGSNYGSGKIYRKSQRTGGCFPETGGRTDPGSK